MVYGRRNAPGIGNIASKNLVNLSHLKEPNYQSTKCQYYPRILSTFRYSSTLKMGTNSWNWVKDLSLGTIRNTFVNLRMSQWKKMAAFLSLTGKRNLDIF